MPAWADVTNGVISDAQYRDFLKAARGFGFSQRLIPRGANSHQAGKPTFQQVENLLAVSPDFAEFIVPVFWSRQEFVGAIPKSKSDHLTLLKQGYELISSAGVAEASRMPPLVKGYEPPVRRVGKKEIDRIFLNMPPNHWEVDYMGWAYVDGTIRGTALQTTPNAYVRRQGWLLVGRKGIVLMGLRTNLSPAMAFQMNYPDETLNNTRLTHIKIATNIPNDVEGCELYVEEFLKYEEIESISQVDLVRFDGLAALLYMLNHIKWIGVIDTPPLTYGSDIINFSAFHQGLPGGYRKLVRDNYIPAVFERIQYGANVVSGTGVDADGYPNLTLFNSALGLAVQSAANGRRFFLESPFQELDAALSLIESEVDAATTISEVAETTGAAASSSLASEIERLAALKQAGLLSDAEYSAAKSKLLS